MNFLEARRLLAQFPGGPELPFLFGLSGTGDPFRLYLEASAAARGRSARPRFLPFNTLGQHLTSGAADGQEVYLLLPWDLVTETDWRSGVPAERIDVRSAIHQAEEVAESLRRRPGAKILYLPAPIPPLAGHAEGQHALTSGLSAIAAGLGAVRVPAAAFSLGAYFGSGCPVGGASIGEVAELAVEALTRPNATTFKVLVTDLDNTLWSGVIAEDGFDGISFRPEGAGYRHYVYQSLLARLRVEGVLLAAVSRNDAAVVLPPLRSGQMLLHEEDFVAVVASYHAKSAQIRQLAMQLNLGLDSFVFIDDNPVELEEVEQELPLVRTIAFPKHDEGFPAFLDLVAASFARPTVTTEDRDRTELYRRRMEGMAPAEAQGADLTRFLTGLEMRLVIHDRSNGDRTRAVQLINKTNQFNANGRRWTDEEIAAVLARGGKLLGASLADRSGSHGEIISCLVGPEGTIEAFVLSCRVFQRRVEHGFLAALAKRGERLTGVRYAPTERNEPFAHFARDKAFAGASTGLMQFDATGFAEAHGNDLALFEVTWD